MTRVRRFDHDEAFARWQSGESYMDLAHAYGVNRTAIVQAIGRRIPEQRERINTYNREYQRGHLQRPCVRGCGRLAWHMHGRTGVCIECSHTERRAEAVARDNHGTETRYSLGCRCDDCRRAASDAKRRRREASRVLCSHGCGTLVDSINRRIPDKPIECKPCAMRRIKAEHCARKVAA